MFFVFFLEKVTFTAKPQPTGKIQRTKPRFERTKPRFERTKPGFERTKPRFERTKMTFSKKNKKYENIMQFCIKTTKIMKIFTNVFKNTQYYAKQLKISKNS